MPPHAHVSTAPALAPADAFVRLQGKRGVFWLDSSRVRVPDGRFSIMGAEPRWVFSARGNSWELRRRDGKTERGGGSAIASPPPAYPQPASADGSTCTPLQRIEALLNAHRASPPLAAPDLPFCGGAVGWLAYDLGRQFETLPGAPVDDAPVPDIRLAWYDTAIVWDHVRSAQWFVGVDGERRASDAIAELAEWLQDKSIERQPEAPVPGIAHSDFTRAEYMARVAEIRDGIGRGEYYQLNLVQRFVCPHHEPAACTYLRLRAHNPAPFAAFLDAEDICVLSSAPERFIEVTPEGHIRTCPIKGTRPRGVTSAEDEANQQELLGSTKERAELLMIVDLLRNDLGRVCQPGTVNVTRLHALESFATVHHLVGEVEGQLRPGIARSELLRAVFPGGSITGAPKVSAMCAIDHFERHRRGIAMGSLGYFSADGRIDLNIAIRTIVSQRGKAYVSVGAGIVWDSDPAAEYAETLIKARALFAALGVKPAAS